MTSAPSKTTAQQALKLLEQAWAYYTPMPIPVPQTEQPEQADLFQYANAA
ncbi:hypothetical protein QEZ52_05295 [Aliisedimentitalea scapharcae]|uniref:Uncharacterized protein n=1 Tax=Aliisedimentitalea scapharcae TaxID=1524259 RepID=A0ABZ2XV28_9RHOB|nr:hypothetical protein K3727_05190 [Rhodobacteraceae bacterium M382]